MPRLSSAEDDLLVVCSACKSVHEDERRWCPSDEYIARLTKAKRLYRSSVRVIVGQNHG